MVANVSASDWGWFSGQPARDVIKRSWSVGGFERSLAVLWWCWYRIETYGRVILGIRSRSVNEPAQRITEPLGPVGRFGGRSEL